MNTTIDREYILDISHKATFTGISEEEVISLLSSYFKERNKPEELYHIVFQFLQASGMLGVAFENILEIYQKRYHICKVIDTKNNKIIAIF